jgi:hypothetical protein
MYHRTTVRRADLIGGIVSAAIVRASALNNLTNAQGARQFHASRETFASVGVTSTSSLRDSCKRNACSMRSLTG